LVLELAMPVKKKNKKPKKTAHKNLRTVFGLFGACTVANFLFFLLIVNFCSVCKPNNEMMLYTF